MATMTLTDSQADIIGYALRLAIRDQKGKLTDLMTTASENTCKSFVAQVDGYHERIARMEDAYNLLPV